MSNLALTDGDFDPVRLVRARAGRSLDQGAGGGAQLARRTTSACRRQVRGGQRRPAVMPPPASPAHLSARALSDP